MKIHYKLGMLYTSLKNNEKGIYYFENAVKNGTSKEKGARAFIGELRKE